MSTASIAAPPDRPADGHKYDFGTTCIVGGCCGDRHSMLGAPVLAARAALRSGCGAVRLCVPQPLANSALVLLPEVTVQGMPVRSSGRIDLSGGLDRIIDIEADSAVVGPGLGSSRNADDIVSHVLGTEGPPTVIDADGITALTHVVHDFEPSREIVLTPHTGEYARLARRFDLSDAVDGIDERRRAAEVLAQRTRCTVLLKGRGSVVASPGQDTWTCPHGSNVLAVPGSGDVLAGLIGGLLAAWVRRGTCDVAAVTRLAVQVHALAGEAWRENVASRGMLASELADRIPCVLDGMVAS
ncbi:MAG: NAD(P)H-hydrate dehydratase [Phycisphaerales bacterium]|nr:NAD(P)H-hydrate dehydratase [Phycisphaerales bacterium]